MRHLATLALLAAVALGGCSPEPAADTPSSAHGPIAVADAAVASAGDDALRAALSVIVALDLGYGIEAIVVAINDGRFDGQIGIIRGSDGGPLLPAGTDSRIISDKPTLEGSIAAPAGALPDDWAHGFSRAAPNPGGDLLLAELLDSISATFSQVNFGAKNVDDLFVSEELPAAWAPLTERQVRDRLGLVAVLGLAAAGYSAEQIVWAVIGVERIECPPASSLDAGAECKIRDQAPALPAVNVFDTPPTSPDEVEEATSPASTQGEVFTGRADLLQPTIGGTEYASTAQFELRDGALTGEFIVASALEVFDGEGYNPGCHYVRGVLNAVTLAGDGTYDGVVTVDNPNPVLDAACMPGFNPTGASNLYDVDVVITVDGDSIVGAMATHGWSFTATRD